MKIASLKISNFLGLRHLDVALRELNFVAGLNASGKSSLENAIRLAFTGDLTRVDLKKDIGKLVTEGAKEATIVIDGDPGGNVTITASGKATGLQNPENVPWFAYALTNQTYLSSLEPMGLRRVLFEMSGGTAKAEIVKRLIQGGGDPALVTSLDALLVNFEAAEKEAGSQATQARGEWKGITGETYGEVKAETWKAVKPAVPPQPEDRELFLQTAVDELRQSIADAKAAAGQRANLEKALVQAQELAGLVERREIAVAAALRLVDEHKGIVSDLEGKAAGKGMPDPLAVEACPECGSVLCVMPPNLPAQPAITLIGKEAYDEANKAKPDPKAKLKLAEQQKALTMLENSHRNAVRDRDAAVMAAARVTTLRDQLEDLPGPGGQGTAEHELAKAINALEAHLTEWKHYTDATKAVREADGKTERASRTHKTAVAWAKLKELLSPNGVPAQFLDGVLTKMNDRMRTSADRTKWSQVQIHADMSITFGGRSRGLCSESEKWRCDAMLTEAIGYLTAECFLMLDRLDVLHPDQRGVCLEWCDKLVTEGVQIMLFATLKGKPELQGVNVVWLDKGEGK